MDIMKKVCMLLTLTAYASLSAQTIKTATASYGSFVSQLARDGQSLTAYNMLYQSYQQYASVLAATSAGDADHTEAKAGLKKVFPYLGEAVYYYYQKKDSKSTLLFAEAYVDITLLDDMRGEPLPIDQQYGTFAWMPATKYYNGKQYDKAVRYLQAYINSGNAERRANAYYYMAKSYLNMQDNARALQVLQQGLLLYPNDLSMLEMAINQLAESKDDDAALQQYIDAAISQKPQDAGLLNFQGQLYERAQQWEKAIAVYNKLRQIQPQNLTVVRHQAVDNYNAAVSYAWKADEAEKKSMKKQYQQQASALFSTSTKLLNDVLANEPLAIDYAMALAKAYAYTGNTSGLDDINKRIARLGSKPVSQNSELQLMAYDSQIAKVGDITNPQPNNVQPTPKTTPGRPMRAMSKVDKDIPVVKTKNDNTFVTIIANERYTKVAPVPYAERDGEVFAEYCNKTLGIPKENIRKHLSVGLADMLGAIDDIKGIARAKHGHCNIIFYYAGHGVPDDDSKEAFILPTDADGRNTRLCYRLSELYGELAKLEADNTTVFLDACFSGATRDKDKMLKQERSIAIKVEEEDVPGRMVVFSAASGNQTAAAYDDEHHGMFTYYLLEKLKETKGNVDLGTLGEYISSKVALQSRLKNNKDQTPTVQPGAGMDGGWKKIKLR